MRSQRTMPRLLRIRDRTLDAGKGNDDDRNPARGSVPPGGSIAPYSAHALPVANVRKSGHLRVTWASRPMFALKIALGRAGRQDWTASPGRGRKGTISRLRWSSGRLIAPLRLPFSMRNQGLAGRRVANNAFRLRCPRSPALLGQQALQKPNQIRLPCITLATIV